MPAVMGMYTAALRPLLFRLDAELVHRNAIRASALAGALPLVNRAVRARYAFSDPCLETEVCGIRFANPVGLAAGYDKEGRAVGFLGALGFGFIEIGSVSAFASDGNPRPRLFRLPLDGAIVVNYGLPNDGAEAVAERLARGRRDVPLGINIVKTNTRRADAEDEIIQDYVLSVRRLMEHADYLMLNLSCPNTETGRDFFAQPEHTTRLMEAVSELRPSRPVFLKVSPLGGAEAIDSLLEAVDPFGFVSGFEFNLPPGKSVGLETPRDVVDKMPGTVAGKPVETVINAAVRELYVRMDAERYRIIASGGVFTAGDAYRKIRLGASLVQLLTGLVYEGPGVVKRIKRGLCELLARDGFSSVAEAVGVDVQ